MYPARQGRAELEAAHGLRWKARPIVMPLSEGQMSDQMGAVLLFSRLPRAKELLADKGCDSDWFHHHLRRNLPLLALINES